MNFGVFVTAYRGSDSLFYIYMIYYNLWVWGRGVILDMSKENNIRYD